jgi:tetratricopeptide (TPR) repeat protein
MRGKTTVLLALISFLAALALSAAAQRLYPPILREELKVVPKRQIAELLSFDHRGFLADMYFIQVSLHSGSLMWKPLKFQFNSPWAYGMMDLITDLDPRFFSAYLFAGMGLIHNFDDVKRAKPILEKGMAVFPNSWELPFWIGYDHYVYLMDHATAAVYLGQAARKPGAPKRFLSMLLAAQRKSGDYEGALWALRILFETAKDPKLKFIYARKLIQLQNLNRLQKAAEAYEQQTGGFPTDLGELVRSGLIEALPEDPFGQLYLIDEKNRRVVLGTEDKKKQVL